MGLSHLCRYAQPELKRPRHRELNLGLGHEDLVSGAWQDVRLCLHRHSVQDLAEVGLEKSLSQPQTRLDDWNQYGLSFEQKYRRLQESPL